MSKGRSKRTGIKEMEKILLINGISPYYILFFVFDVAGVVFGMSLMGIGILKA